MGAPPEVFVAQGHAKQGDLVAGGWTVAELMQRPEEWVFTFSSTDIAELEEAASRALGKPIEVCHGRAAIS